MVSEDNLHDLTFYITFYIRYSIAIGIKLASTLTWLSEIVIELRIYGDVHVLVNTGADFASNSLCNRRLSPAHLEFRATTLKPMGLGECESPCSWGRPTGIIYPGSRRYRIINPLYTVPSTIASLRRLKCYISVKLWHIIYSSLVIEGYCLEHASSKCSS